MIYSVKHIAGKKPMKNNVKSGDDCQQNIFAKKECEALKGQFSELYVLYTLGKKLKKAVALAQQKNYMVYSCNTIYTLKGLKVPSLPE